ncbi:hypothetical protein ACPA0F_08930 [Solibacillus silvestris]
MPRKRKGEKRIKKYTCPACQREFIPVIKDSCFCDECRDREREKIKLLFENMSDEFAVGLAGAIIKQAIFDYISTIKKWRNAYTAERNAYYFDQVKYLSAYFKSDDFEAFAMNLNGRFIQKNIHDEIYKAK